MGIFSGMGSDVPTIYVLSKNKKNIQFFLAKISNFTSEKNPCLLHGQVFVMAKESEKCPAIVALQSYLILLVFCLQRVLASPKIVSVY